MTEPAVGQPQVTATVSPAPPPRSRWGAIPHHLGRARTSTVVLSVLFLAIGALWLNIRPDPAPPPTTPVVVDRPVVPAPTSVPETSAPPSDPAPTTSAEPTTTAPETTTVPEPSPTEQTPRFTPTTEPSPPAPPSTGAPSGTPAG